ncbi:uncharacterized protein [Nicotiana sylvestris]|uniref:uncharacterized protein n=1 Tax=Nicotiana sylvestris TaxID=4096 RepID=UPI00388C9E2B
MEFGERLIGLVFGIISNNWYSVMINGQPYGFFKSTRGVKQGDPLSPTLFIPAAEALSRGLNALHLNLHFCGFGLPKWSPKITHLAYADDTIIFSSSDATSLQLIMQVLFDYEAASRQLINKSKSIVYLHHNTPVEVVNKVKRISEINRSHIWTKMIECRDIAEHQIGWHPRMGSSLFWYKNWMGLGALYFITPPDLVIDESVNNVHDVVQEGAWDVDKLKELFPEEYATHIIENIKPPVASDILDKPFWMLETRGSFSVKSAWEFLRKRNDPSIAYSKLWTKGLPFKISFFLWKVWKAKLPLDDWMRQLGYSMPSKCWCCAQEQESMPHLFFTSDAATRVWTYFLTNAGITMEGLSLHQVIVKCWTSKVVYRLQHILQVLPAIIV